MSIFNFTPQSIAADIFGAIDFINQFNAIDTIGIYDAISFEQVFSRARPVEADVRETSRTLQYPTELGVMIPDHRVINAIEIDFSMIIKIKFFDETYNQIKNYYESGNLLIAQTKTGAYLNMFISNMPHIESPDMYNAIAMNLRLMEKLIIPITLDYSPAAATDINPEYADYSEAVDAGFISNNDDILIDESTLDLD